MATSGRRATPARPADRENRAAPAKDETCGNFVKTLVPSVMTPRMAHHPPSPQAPPHPLPPAGPQLSPFSTSPALIAHLAPSRPPLGRHTRALYYFKLRFKPLMYSPPWSYFHEARWRGCCSVFQPRRYRPPLPTTYASSGFCLRAPPPQSSFSTYPLNATNSTLSIVKLTRRALHHVAAVRPLILNPVDPREALAILCET